MSKSSFTDVDGAWPSRSSCSHPCWRRRSGMPRTLRRGCAYTMQPPPNYGFCTDAGDATQLTDGVLTENYFWTQPTTVGWQGTPVVLLTIDLGADAALSRDYPTARQPAWPVWRGPGKSASR